MCDRAAAASASATDLLQETLDQQDRTRTMWAATRRSVRPRRRPDGTRVGTESETTAAESQHTQVKLRQVAEHMVDLRADLPDDIDARES